MHRVDTSTAAPALPASDPAGTPGYFTKGSPGAGTLATVPGQDWFNAVQEELINVLVQSGITPDKADRTQLWAALVAQFVRLSGAQTIAGNKTLTGTTTLGTAIIDTTGKMTAGTVPLARMGTVDLNGTVALAAGASAEFSISGTAGTHGFFQYSVYNTDSTTVVHHGSDSSGPPANQAFASVYQTYPGFVAGPGRLFIKNNTAGSRTFAYKLYKITES